MKNIYVKPEEQVVTNGTAQAPIPQVPIPKITYAQGGVATVTGQPTNYGNLMGGGTSVPPSSDMSNATIPEYYKYAYDVGVQNAERTRYNAVQNARAQYNQFINPYGAMANQQAQAGLTGGGYSQFLQGQAYQSMIDSQNMARATEAATKQTLYGDYLKGMAEYNQAEKNKQEQTAVATADLLNNIGTYSSLEAVDAALDALNITDAAQRKTYTDAWNNQVVSTFLNDIANNKFASWDDLKSLMANKGITQGDSFIKIANAWTENMYKKDNITEIVNAINSGTYATEEDLVSALDSKNITGETRNNLINQFRENQQNTAKNILAFEEEIQGEADANRITNIGKAYGIDQSVIDSAIYANSYLNIDSEEGWNNFFNKGKAEDGTGGWFDKLTEDEQNAARESYTNWKGEKEGILDGDTYVSPFNEGALNEGSAENILNRIVKDNNISEELKNLIQADYDTLYKEGKANEQVQMETTALSSAKTLAENKGYSIKHNANVVNTKGAWNLTDFGKFNDAGTGEGEQDKYLNAVVSSITENNIGKIILPNYGENAGKTEAYMYIGDGKFVQINWEGNLKPLKANLFIPDGYYESSSQIKKK